MNKVLTLTFLPIVSLIFLSIFFLPSLVSAQSIEIPCTGPFISEEFGAVDCDFASLMRLISNVLDFLIILSIPLATIAFAWAGFLMLTAAGSESKVSQAKEIFWKVLIGFIFVLSAWLIVRFITTALLNENN